jgi:hypothetical protein
VPRQVACVGRSSALSDQCACDLCACDEQRELTTLLAHEPPLLVRADAREGRCAGRGLSSTSRSLPSSSARHQRSSSALLLGLEHGGSPVTRDLRKACLHLKAPRFDLHRAVSASGRHPRRPPSLKAGSLCTYLSAQISLHVCFPLHRSLCTFPPQETTPFLLTFSPVIFSHLPLQEIPLEVFRAPRGIFIYIYIYILYYIYIYIYILFLDLEHGGPPVTRWSANDLLAFDGSAFRSPSAIFPLREAPSPLLRTMGTPSDPLSKGF